MRRPSIRTIAWFVAIGCSGVLIDTVKSRAQTVPEVPHAAPGPGAATATPWHGADAPQLVSLSYGAVLGSLDYEVEIPLGQLLPIGLGPGYPLVARVRTGSTAGSCGGSCQLGLAHVVLQSSAYSLTERDGSQRRLETSGDGRYHEVALRSELPPSQATGHVHEGELVLEEEDGTVRTFDVAGRERRVANPLGAVDLHYAASGQLQTITNDVGDSLALTYADGRVAAVTDATGFTVNLHYSAEGRLLMADGPQDSGGSPALVLTWLGADLTSISQRGLRPVELTYAAGKIASVTDLNGTAIAFRGAADRIEMASSAGQRQVLHVVDGRIDVVEGGNGGLTRYVRDARKRVTEIRVATATGELVTSFTYDDQNRKLSATDPDGNVQRWAYDAAGHVTVFTDARGHATRYEYDAHGWLTRRTDPLGRATTFVRNAAGLPLSATSQGFTRSMTYNAHGEILTSTNALGEVTTATYDDKGRLASLTQPGSPPMAIAHSAVPNGEQIVQTMGSKTMTMVIDKYGRMTSKTLPDGAVESRVYDPSTGLMTATVKEFRGTRTSVALSHTNTGDVNTISVNGLVQQAGARVVPPGTPPEMPCAEGHRLVDNRCEAINPCADGTAMCDAHADCVFNPQTPGTSSCVCRAGFEGDGHMCQCRAGFNLIGSECVIHDPCADGTAMCDQHATCAFDPQHPGTHSCTCRTGFEGDGHYCQCPNGFQLVNDHCEPRNPCADGTAMCDPHATCAFDPQHPGTHGCTCRPGFEGDGHYCHCPGGFHLVNDHCEPQNPCTDGTAMCDPHASCVFNPATPGAYSCACGPGFHGDGHMCWPE